jgi:tetratricopeptide (TPR) repeat protein
VSSHEEVIMKGLGTALFLIGVVIATTAAYHVLKRDQVLYHRAEVRFARQDYVAAAPLYRDALQAGFRNAKIRTRLAYSLLRAGQVDAAAVIYEQIFREQPERLSAVIDLADVYAVAGRLDKAAELYRSALRKHPGTRSIWIRLARVLVGDGRFAEAVTAYRQVLGDES